MRYAIRFYIISHLLNKRVDYLFNTPNGLRLHRYMQQAPSAATADIQ